LPQLVVEPDLATLPKVELHVHVNGSITEALAGDLARRHGGVGADAGVGRDGRYPARYPNFEGFLATLVAANSFVRTPDDLELVAAAFVREQARQRIAWSEPIFTAMMYVRNGMEPDAMWAALRRGLSAAGPETRVGIVVDVIRDFGPDEAAETLRLVHRADAPIVGLGLTGIEGTVPTEAFIPFRAEARRLGLGFEVHAGEMGPPASIVAALDVLEADRIGHGVAAIRDPILLERLVREQVVLDVCPSSNVAIGEYPSLEEHPMGPFWRAGVRMTISSDDPPFFRTSLTTELAHLVRVAGLDRADLATLQRRTARAAFADAATKDMLVAAIDAWETSGAPPGLAAGG
jgi:adenosine deaminase